MTERPRLPVVRMPRPDVDSVCRAALERAHLSVDEEVVLLLASAVERGLEGADGFVIAPGELADALVDRISSTDVAALGTVRAADVALATACAAGRADAIAVFDAIFGPEIPRVIARTQNRTLDVAELRGAAFERLFTGAKPKIVEYSGAGDLRSWVRTLLVRLSLDLSRKRVEQPVAEGDAASFDGALPQGDPEIEYFKGLYRGAFKAAFEDAVAELDAEERSLLRMHLVHGSTIDELAGLFRVHRATVARRIGRAREDLVTRTKRTLMANLKLDRSAYDSVIRLIESDVHVSLSRVL